MSQAKQAMVQTTLQPLQSLLVFSLTGAEEDSVELDAESDLVSLSSHFKGLVSDEEGW